MYLFGGHDGTRHLNDVHVFDFEVSVRELVFWVIEKRKAVEITIEGQSFGNFKRRANLWK